MKTVKCITVLDFEIGRVYQYRIGVNNIEGSEYPHHLANGGEWNPDSESCEKYLTNKGHNLGNCEWMVHDISKIITKNKVDL